MAERDVTRELVRRAYADLLLDDSVPDLDEVVRRAGRPLAAVEQARHPVNLRRRRRLALAGVFAGVVGLILVVGLSSGRIGGGGAPIGVQPRPSVAPSDLPAGDGSPIALATSCIAAWKLTFANGQFSATARNGYACALSDAQRVYVLDTAEGNGRIYPGAAKLWPARGIEALKPPFTFSVPGIPAAVDGHYYQLVYLGPGALPSPGTDASQSGVEWLDLSLTFPQPSLPPPGSGSPFVHTS
ncbi:hypothetical protein [Dactylosporangium sp. NPDC051541]|uniref:hypothetical protein n=1 Tax=Dactylosporangium sp. NPDC051541 TaxID=3363977 RepID=UPI0037BA8D3B